MWARVCRRFVHVIVTAVSGVCQDEPLWTCSMTGRSSNLRWERKSLSSSRHPSSDSIHGLTMLSVNPHKRLFGYCADRQRVAAAKYEVVARTGQLLRALILFDHVTLHSLRLREFKGLVSDLCIE